MEKILSIHTSLPRAIVALSEGDKLISCLTNGDTVQHAAFLHEAMQQLLKEAVWAPRDLSALSVTAGPGSYTGIRVGLSAAKGMCFALNIPLVVMNTLECLALTAIQEMNFQPAAYVAALQARRNEMFVAAYHANLEETMRPALIQPADFRLETDQEIILTGNGAGELKAHTDSQWHTCLPEEDVSEKALISLTRQKFNNKCFADVYRADAIYLKGAYVKTPGS